MLCAEDRIDTAFFPYGPGSPGAMIHNDHLATPQKMTDSSGTVVWSADYKPFGEATVTISTITNNLRFPGQYYDAETGLNYNYYRDYNPTIGRYIEADRIGLLGGINLFVYAGSNSVNYGDPLGLNTIAIGAGIGTLIEPGLGTAIGAAIGAGVAVGTAVAIYSRGHNDPITGLAPVDPGRDCDKKCKPCPPDSIVWDHTHLDGTRNGHQIVWNQDPNTCVCYPKRIHISM